jgi:hypothetical protein
VINKDLINNLHSTGETNHQESGAYIVLNNDDATLGFRDVGEAGNNNSAPVPCTKWPGGEASLDLNDRDATVPHTGGTQVIVGSIHPHPTPTNGNTLVSGVSVTNNPSGGNDLTTARDTNAPVYAVDRNYIHKVDQNGNISNQNPRTKEVLKDALETKGGKNQ